MSFDDPVICIQDLSKRFEIYAHPYDQLKQFLYPRIRRRLGLEFKQYFQEFWALQDISFEIHRGESWGIVGMNGSGKSTLLQIIAGTLPPTLGNIDVQGKVVALLELGSGFNPNFTGRENVRLYSALLGISQTELDKKLEEIQNFADIGDHFDQPLATYSSGMQMRLAFAVATASYPEVLIIDEALAVGDAYFQQKCFHRIDDFQKQGGTLLFVSHDSNAVKQLCDNALLLDGGRMISCGTPKDVIDLYYGIISKISDKSGSEVSIDQMNNSCPDTSHYHKRASIVTTNHNAELLDFQIFNSDNKKIKHIVSESEIVVQYKIKHKKNFSHPAYGIIVRDRLGRSIYEISTYSMSKQVQPVEAQEVRVISFRLFFNLRAGHYSFSIGVANKGYGRSDFEEYSLLMHDVELIEVLENSLMDYYGGVFNMHAKVEVSSELGKS